MWRQRERRHRHVCLPLCRLFFHFYNIFLALDLCFCSPTYMAVSAPSLFANFPLIFFCLLPPPLLISPLYQSLCFVFFSLPWPSFPSYYLSLSFSCSCLTSIRSSSSFSSFLPRGDTWPLLATNKPSLCPSFAPRSLSPTSFSPFHTLFTPNPSFCCPLRPLLLFHRSAAPTPPSPSPAREPRGGSSSVSLMMPGGGRLLSSRHGVCLTLLQPPRKPKNKCITT